MAKPPGVTTGSMVVGRVPHQMKTNSASFLLSLSTGVVLKGVWMEAVENRETQKSSLDRINNKMKVTAAKEPNLVLVKKQTFRVLFKMTKAKVSHEGLQYF